MARRSGDDGTSPGNASGRRGFLRAAMGGVAALALGTDAAASATARDTVAGPLVGEPPVFGHAGRRIGTIFKSYPHAGALQSSLCGEPAALGERPALAASNIGDFRLWQWMSVLRHYRHAPRIKQLYAVNNFVNQVPFVTDEERYGATDRWACPAQFFSGGGDCEDYVIAKHRSLRWLGFHPDRLRLVIGRLEPDNIAHAVLAVFLDGRTAILDNRHRDVREDIEPRGFRPLVSMTDRETWMHD